MFTTVPQISLLSFCSAGGVREPGLAKSLAGDVWVWLRLELGLTRAARSTRSLLGSGVETSFSRWPYYPIYLLHDLIELGARHYLTYAKAIVIRLGINPE